MVRSIIRIGIIIIAVILQVSFFPVVFSENRVPNFILLLTIAWVLSIGFKKSFYWIIILGIFLDLVSLEIIGLNVIFLVVAGYLVSLASRRFLVEHRFWANIMISVVVIMGTFLSYYFNQFVGHNFYVKINFQDIIAQAITSLIIFFIVYLFLEKLENYLSFYERKIKI